MIKHNMSTAKKINIVNYIIANGSYRVNQNTAILLCYLARKGNTKEVADFLDTSDYHVKDVIKKEIDKNVKEYPYLHVVADSIYAIIDSIKSNNRCWLCCGAVCLEKDIEDLPYGWVTSKTSPDNVIHLSTNLPSGEHHTVMSLLIGTLKKEKLI